MLGDPGKQADVNWHEDTVRGTTWLPRRAPGGSPPESLPLPVMADVRDPDQQAAVARPRRLTAQAS